MRKAILATAILELAAMPLAVCARPTQSPPPAQSDSVAEAARKAREQKRNAPKPAKVYTNDDLSNVSAVVSVVGAPPAAPKPAGEQSAEPAGNKEAKPAVKDQAYWQKAFAEARARLRHDEEELEVLQRELSQLNVQYYPEPQKAMEQQFSRKDINEKRAKIDAKQKDIQQDRQDIADLADQLRKSGGDPGWARE